MVNLNLSREETIKEHRKMWNWIADEIMRVRVLPTNIHELKFSYFVKNRIADDEIPYSECYCCDYTYCDGCSLCPIDWKNTSGKQRGCYNIDSPYRKLVDLLKLRNVDREGLSSYAREIANLPEMEED